MPHRYTGSLSAWTDCLFSVLYTAGSSAVCMLVVLMQSQVFAQTTCLAMSFRSHRNGRMCASVNSYARALLPFPFPWGLFPFPWGPFLLPWGPFPLLWGPLLFSWDPPLSLGTLPVSLGTLRLSLGSATTLTCSYT